jgi:hypothetical protein
MWEWDATSLAGALKSTATRHFVHHIKPLHAVFFKLGLSASAILATSLAHLALRCGLLGYACAMFDEMPRNLNLLITRQYYIKTCQFQIQHRVHSGMLFNLGMREEGAEEDEHGLSNNERRRPYCGKGASPWEES